MNSINDFIENNIGLQGIKVLSANVSNDTIYIRATSAHDCAVCPNCGHIAYDVHDKRWQLYKHLPIWGINTIIVLEKKRYKCSCDPKHPFDEHFEFTRPYQRQTIPFEKYAAIYELNIHSR